METTHVGRRRTLPPVPRPAGGNRPEPAPAVDPGRRPVSESDAAQEFVARLRASAGDFASAALAQSAVVPEAVPPARHRRARCRVVLRYGDDTDVDLTFLGAAGEPGVSRLGFDQQIRRWLSAGQVLDDAWLVPDPDAPDGVAVDLMAWLAAGQHR